MKWPIKKWYLTFLLGIDKEVFNIMLVKKYAPNCANWVQKCKISLGKGALPPYNPHQGALPPGPPFCH